MKRTGLLLLSLLLSTASLMEAGVDLSGTSIMPYIGMRELNHTNRFQNAFVMGGALRQQLTRHVSLQARGGLLRTRENGFDSSLTTKPFVGIDGLISIPSGTRFRRLQPSFIFAGYSASSFNSSGSLHLGLGWRASTSKHHVRPTAFVHTGNNIEVNLGAEANVDTLLAHLYGTPAPRKKAAPKRPAPKPKKRAQRHTSSTGVRLEFRQEHPLSSEEPAIYKVIAAAFLNQKSAQTLKTRLLNTHHVPSQIVSGTSEDGIFYRVQVGQYRKSSDAIQALNTLRKHTFKDAYYVYESL